MDDFEILIKKDKVDLKRKTRILSEDYGVYVYAVVVSDEGNHISIPVEMGEPLGDCCYDLVKDVVYVVGDDYHDIGYIPVNYKFCMDGVDWTVDVPLPYAVIKRHMSNRQIQDFEEWKSIYKKKNIEFVQFLSTFGRL